MIAGIVSTSTAAYDARSDSTPLFNVVKICAKTCLSSSELMEFLYKTFRVEAQSKMTLMREKAVKDLAQYSAEMKELERVIAHECSLKEFMTTKCNERNGQDNGHEMGHRQCKTV